MERKEAIRSAYRLTGSSSFYDGMMTCSTLPGRLVCRLDYDFSLADKDAAMHSGVIARTIVLDRRVGEYLAAHPGATVMNLACGLDTRCYRMQGYAHWYNLDLPETIAVREALLPESGSISQLAMSAMDDWGAAVEGPSGPALVIIEGLTMYLTQADVQRIFAVIAGRFPAATVFTETMNPMVVKRFKEKSIEGSKAKFTWGVKDGRALAALLPGFRLAGEHCLTEGMAAFVPVYRLLDKLPLIRNISNRIAILQGTGEEEQPAPPPAPPPPPCYPTRRSSDLRSDEGYLSGQGLPGDSRPALSRAGGRTECRLRRTAAGPAGR